MRVSMDMNSQKAFLFRQGACRTDSSCEKAGLLRKKSPAGQEPADEGRLHLLSNRRESVDLAGMLDTTRSCEGWSKVLEEEDLAGRPPASRPAVAVACA